MIGKTVSLIIPAYNAEKHIAKCLCSVHLQTYKKLQIIVVDDGSADDTLRNIELASGQFDELILIHQENMGVSSSRNAALDRAKGEYVCFLDADDALEPDAIEILVNAIENSDADWVSCQYSRWNEDGERLEDYDFRIGEYVFGGDDDRLKFLTGVLLRYHIGFEVWNKLYRTDIVKSHDIKFPERCRIGEDLAFNIKYLMYSKKLISIPDRLIRYSVGSCSAMGKHTDLADKISENIYMLEDVWNYFYGKDSKYMLCNFPCVLVRVLDNSYVGHTASEVSTAFCSLKNILFIIERYREIGSVKKEILSSYPSDVARIKYRFHLYVRSRIDNRYLADGIMLFIYDIYRRARGLAILENWRMPY